MNGWDTRRLAAVRSHAEVGRLVGLSKRSVQNIERTAIAKLRALLVERGVGFEDAMPTDDHPAGMRDRRERLPVTDDEVMVA